MSSPLASDRSAHPEAASPDLATDQLADPKADLPAQPALSVVIPLRDEAQAIGPVLRELTAAFNAADFLQIGGGWECWAVDDGSADGTAQLVEAFARIEPRVRLLRLGQRRAKTAALSAGFAAARGQLIGTMDGDGQCDPADLLRLVQALRRENWDMARGVRPGRNTDSLAKRWASRIANAVRRWLLPDGIEDAASPLMVSRPEAQASLPLFEGAHRFLGSLALIQGWRVGQIPVGWRPRRAGRSKYGLVSRAWRGWADLLRVRRLRRSRPRSANSTRILFPASYPE
jgi:dolichol-phosphate mannosyltransferase